MDSTLNPDALLALGVRQHAAACQRKTAARRPRIDPAGLIFKPDGTLVASVAQEGSVRQRK